MSSRTDVEKHALAKKYDEETKLGSSRDKMWTLYMNQAGAFDHKMVEDWKGMMEGTLIFAGLFSAVVTGFMIESLRKLGQDGTPGPPLLTESEIPAPSPYYIAINVLWSLSLAFSMGCAISATLVQQWARSYLHAVDNQHQPPHKRALIRAYMYEGMGESHMTFAIEGIPILLHISLFLFLIGLIVYFYGIHPLIAYPIMAAFILSITMYLIPTCMPLVRSNFPFHTPASTPIWWAWRITKHREPLRSARTMEVVREHHATHHRRNQRGYEAVSWVLSQSDEEREFEEFLDAIAGFKGGSDPEGGRVLVARLVRDFPREILLRTYTMLRLSGRLTKKPDNRTTVVLRVIPALAISWSTIPQKDSYVRHLVQWPLQMLEALDKDSVAGNKSAFDSDLVVSTYYVLLHIAIEGVKVKTELTHHGLSIDHELDNIKAAREFVFEKQGRKSTQVRPFDMIIDVLLSSSFRGELSKALQSDDTKPLVSYANMLLPLCSDGAPQERLAKCAYHILLNPSLSEVHDRFLDTNSFMHDKGSIDLIISEINSHQGNDTSGAHANKIKEILSHKFVGLKSVSPSPSSTRPPSHKEPSHLKSSETVHEAHNMGGFLGLPRAAFVAEASPDIVKPVVDDQTYGFSHTYSHAIRDSMTSASSATLTVQS